MDMATHRRNWKHAAPGTGTEPGTGTYPWPLLLIAAPAAVAIWSGWVGLGAKCGFGPVNLLPGIGRGFTVNTAITLPVGIESYGVYAMFAWLSLKGIGDRTRDFARKSAAGALGLGILGQVVYHLLAVAGWIEAPWFVVMLVSCLPVITVYLGAALTHLIVADRRAARDAEAERERNRAEVERLRVERAAARAEVPARPRPRRRAGTSAPRNRKPVVTGTTEPVIPVSVAEPAPEPVAAAEPEPSDSVDLAAEARILRALGDGTMDTEKGILALVAAGHKPSKAGVLAGKSDSYGRKVVRTAKDLAAAAPEGQDSVEGES